MHNKLVSVCINAYNSEKYISDTIKSVIDQTYKNLQIIVIDDCSTDNTYNILKSFDDPRLEIYRLPYNCHISNACNEGFKYVKGKYVAHLDSDDLWVPEKIEKQVEFLENNKEYGACFTYAEIIDENGQLADESGDYLRDIYAFQNCTQTDMYRYFYDNSNRLCHPSSLIRTDIIEKLGKHDVTMLYLHDFDYWMRLVTCCHIYILPECLTLVRRHGDNNSKMNASKWIALSTETMRLLYKSINLCPDNLFIEAFSDKLKFCGEHSHDEVELEKAFLLLDGTQSFKNNPVLGLYKFSELFAEEKYIKLAKVKFNFTTRDLYKIQETPCYLDIGERNHLLNSVDRLNGELENEKRINIDISNEISRCNDYIVNLEASNKDKNLHISELKDYISSLENRSKSLENHITSLENHSKSLENHSKSLENHIASLENYTRSLENKATILNKNIDDLRNSFSWKITAPLRYISDKFKNLSLKH